jgi:hypothetical protein
MARGVCWYLAGSVALGVLGVLAGCSGGSFMAEREPWRHQAEAQCVDSGAVKEGTGKVRIRAINGPGMCGADFPMKVSALGEDASVLGYSDELRPPGAVPNGTGAAPLRWPVGQQRVAPAAVRPAAAPPYETGSRYEAPLSLDPPPSSGPDGATYQPYDFRKPFGAPQSPAAPSPRSLAPRDLDSQASDLSPVPYERRRPLDEEPRSAPRFDPPSTIRRAPVREVQPDVPLGPSRAPPVTGAIGAVAVSPAATLACPIVSALDQWIASAVQPAALHWFGQPVVEIKQISAYSCRGMNGNPRANISEHAFGNALDIAAFTLADGRKFTVKDGWHGAPEEQGFLRDVQGAACEQFTTVLAPGSNSFHYDHIHVDLMRRNNGRHACNPRAVSGEEVAARARARYAGKRGGEPSVTGSISQRRLASPPKRLAPSAYSDGRWDGNLPIAEPGDDGED